MNAPWPKIVTLTALILMNSQNSSAAGEFTSLYAFGDGVCTTTGNKASGSLASLYYGNRYCNGSVWIEVLARWQGLAYNAANNISYFGQDSGELITNITAFTPPSDVGTSLFVVWCNNADLVEFSQTNAPPYDSSDMNAWTTFINQAVTRHTQAVTQLYNKGARTLVMPNSVNITAAPYYNGMNANDASFLRQRAIQYNAAFSSAMSTLAASKQGLRIYQPDTFTFFAQVLATPSDYGLVNPGIDAITNLGNPSLTGPGASYIFWDYIHPTAKFQIHLANLVQSQIQPVKVSGITSNGISTQLQLSNVPLGLAGVVEGSASLTSWQKDADLSYPTGTGNSTTKVVTVPTSGPKRFYRVAFPVVWTWP